ncbi:MAG: protein-methionine-sulfoxide reductase catalytic subunit MsrP [Pseudomonadales bacterium]|nr:protein-methionine-sulfoxide reductase catalytic subunit MsrP [Pseudomonadales bacterium]
MGKSVCFPGSCSPKPSEITSKSVFDGRRGLIRALSVIAVGAAISTPVWSAIKCKPANYPKPDGAITPEKFATRYNNYYEFSTDKEAVRFLARDLTLSPWLLKISGEVETPLTLDLDDIRKLCVEERVYRFRCVEGWSMVVPWNGIVLAKILALAKPLSSASYVRFSALHNPKEMIGQRRPTLEWPYQEALRIDEAMHPLTLMATGMYGDMIPPQNGAPLRLVVPWKYGFKSIKAVQTIELLRDRPITTWQKAAPSEYGFYANVNPAVSHPRWSQRREVPLGQSRKRPTLMFNGYQEQVAGLYKHMDLSKHF